MDADTRQELQRILRAAQNAIGREDALILGRIFPSLASVLGDLQLQSGASSVASGNGSDKAASTLQQNRFPFSGIESHEN